jgi:hypothetical protein
MLNLVRSISIPVFPRKPNPWLSTLEGYDYDGETLVTANMSQILGLTKATYNSNTKIKHLGNIPYILQYITDHNLVK